MYDLTPDEWRDLVLSVNVRSSKRRLSPCEAGFLLAKATGNHALDQIAKELNFKDVSTLQKIRSLKEVPLEFREVIDWGAQKGVLSMSTAAQLMRLKLEDDRKKALHAAIEYSFTKDEARQVVQFKERSGEEIEQCIQKTLLTRPRIERRALVLGSLVSPLALKALNEIGVPAAERRIKSRMARLFPDVMIDYLRINGNRFSMGGSPEGVELLRSLLGPKSIEEVVTEALENIQ